MLAPYPTDRLHNQHPPPPDSRQSGQTTKPEIGGSILDADDAPQGVNFVRRNTGRGLLAPALDGFAPTPEMPEIAEAQGLLAEVAR
jgi:hypothetical protein